jgi:hypothetical protein
MDEDTKAPLDPAMDEALPTKIKVPIFDIVLPHKVTKRLYNRQQVNLLNKVADTLVNLMDSSDSKIAVKAASESLKLVAVRKAIVDEMLTDGWEVDSGEIEEGFITSEVDEL